MLCGRLAVAALAVDKRLLAAAPVVMEVVPADNREGVGARDSATTGGLGPPATERGSGEAAPNS